MRRSIATTAAAAAVLVSVGACDSSSPVVATPVATTPVASAPVTATTVVTSPTLENRPFSASSMAADIKGKAVYDAAGNKLGVIRDVVVDSAGVRAIMLEHGGMMGLGGKTTQIPASQLQWVGDKIVAPGLTQQSLG